MDPYVHEILHRNAVEMRALTAPHHRHLDEALAARTAARRRRRLAWVRAVLALLPRHSPAARGPVAAGGRPG